MWRILDNQKKHNQLFFPAQLLWDFLNVELNFSSPSFLNDQNSDSTALFAPENWTLVRINEYYGEFLSARAIPKANLAFSETVVEIRQPSRVTNIDVLEHMLCLMQDIVWVVNNNLRYCMRRLDDCNNPKKWISSDRWSLIIVECESGAKSLMTMPTWKRVRKSKDVGTFTRSDRQTDRQTDRHAGMQTDTQMGKEVKHEQPQNRADFSFSLSGPASGWPVVVLVGDRSNMLLPSEGMCQWAWPVLWCATAGREADLPVCFGLTC